MTAKPISWNELRSRAVAFAAEWRDETREQAEAQSFWNDWFAIFGIKRHRVITFEKQATRTSTSGRGRIDAFWPGMLAVEHKSAGRSLADAEEQALDYLNSLDNVTFPQMVITSDFATFRVWDLRSNEPPVTFPIDDLPDHIERFGFIAGYQSRSVKPEDKVSIEAAEKMGALYEKIADTGFQGHELKVFLVRLMFVFFADDTGVWERGLFTDFVKNRTSDDGTDLGPLIQRLFSVLDTIESKRSTALDSTLAQFPYINGGLFAERLELPDFNSSLRTAVIECSEFDWSAVSPAIFGSLFQSVMDSGARRAIGAHYTSEQNILKVIQPLFLDSLRSEFDRFRSNASRLRALQDKLATLKFLDPAAGCGNFLVIAYRELRDLEYDILAALDDLTGQGQGHLDIDQISNLSKVDVDQFYAIEIEEFPARIAETAIYLVDHLANMRLSKRFGQYYARIPLTSKTNVLIDNACRCDWNDFLPAKECSFVLGNPPFIGRQYRSGAQQDDMRIAHAEARGHGVLDYVTAWYAIAARYMQKNKAIVSAFVSTNSIVQGEGAANLWPRLLNEGIEIRFAIRTFRWANEGRGVAGVHVVIVGFGVGPTTGKRRLYEEVGDSAFDSTLVVREVENINPYLADAPDVVVLGSRRPLIAGVPESQYGSMANDGGHLIIDAEDIDAFQSDPVASKYVREYVGGEEVLNGKTRWCLWLVDAPPRDISASALLRDRVEAVRTYREGRSREATRRAADTPSLFVELRPQDSDYIFVPFVSSERRKYLPLVVKSADDICAAPHWRVPDADMLLFGIMSSRMFATWAESVAGRLEMRLRLSPGTVYNTFPWPGKRDGAAADRVREAAHEVVAARTQFEDSTLAELYDPRLTPPALVKAHRLLDDAVDRLFSRRRIASDADRQALLFDEYVKIAGK